MKKLLKSEIYRSVHCLQIYKTDKKKLKSQPLPATVHMNSSRCPLIECAAAGKKKKKK